MERPAVAVLCVWTVLYCTALYCTVWLLLLLPRGRSTRRAPSRRPKLNRATGKVRHLTICEQRGAPGWSPARVMLDVFLHPAMKRSRTSRRAV
jgi:hypothetical protein